MTLLVDPFGTQWTESESGLILPEPPKRLTAVDLFCGCGGFSLGIIEAGFEVLCGVDWAEDASVTYMANLGTYPIDCRFVTEDDRRRLELFLHRTARCSVGTTWRSGCERPPERPGVPKGKIPVKAQKECSKQRELWGQP